VKIGVISDTHNYLDPQVAEIFFGVQHIVHGGDIGEPHILAELETIAPVTAVSGNTDNNPIYKPTAVVTLSGKKFLVHHIVTPGHFAQPIYQRIATEEPDVVVFGHTHKPFAEQVGKTLFFNPGYAGRQRFELRRSVALMQIDGAEIRHELIWL
jgi:uncharacterized protein